MRTLLLGLILLFPLVGLAAAHFPPAPVLTCQNTYLPGDTSGKYHDYGPGWGGIFIFPLTDGTLADCPKPNVVEVNSLGFCHPETEGLVVVCEPVTTGINQPIWDYDGELDYGGGGAVLFVRTGDGVTEGVTACYGWPSVGHHSTTIYAFDDLTLKGPTFTVTSDYSRPGLESSPDCGDSIIEPCDPNPPQPSGQPFPVNVVIDTVNGVLYTIFGPGGEGCNMLDNTQRCTHDFLTKHLPTRCTLPFGAGADGAVSVFIENDYDQPHFPLGGHVWTT